MYRGSSPSTTVRTVRAAGAGTVGLVVAATALAFLVTVVRHGTAAPAGTARLDDVLLVVLAWVGVLLAAWLALGSLLAVASLLPGAWGRVARAVVERVTPVAVRKVLTLVLGASVGSMALPPAPVSSAGSGPAALAPGYTPSEMTPGYAPTAAPSPGSAGAADSAGSAGSATGATLPAVPHVAVDPGPGYAPTAGRAEQGVGPPAAPRPLDGPGYVPTRPAPVHEAVGSRLMAPTPRPTTSVHDLVTVHRGDSLWAIAARHLGPGVSDAQIAREWPRWYTANRDVIGDDPDLLVPGRQLRPPSTSSSPAERAVGASTAHPSSHVGAGSDARAEHGAR